MRKTRTNKIKKINRLLNDTFRGIFLIFLSLIFFVSIFSYSKTDNCLFNSSSINETKNLLNSFGAYTADILIQTFGLMSFLISALLLVWGINLINGKIHYIKHKFTVFSLFILQGSVIFTVLSSRQFFSYIFSVYQSEYFAGGVIGYSLTKWLFVDLINNTLIIQTVFIVLCIVWFFIFKKAFFINFDVVREQAPKIISSFKTFSSVKQKLESSFRKNSRSAKNDSVWEDDLNTNLHEEDYQNSFESGFNQQSVFSSSVSSDNDFYDEIKEKDENNIDKDQTKHIEEIMRNSIIGNATYTLPSIELLDKQSQKQSDTKSHEDLSALSEELCGVLEEFGVKGEIINVREGPVVTMFEFRPAAGIKTSRVISLSDDIARSMSAVSARISLIPGQNAIGIELPNKKRQTVYLREILSSESFRKFSSGIPLILGKDISGSPVTADLTKMPHLLVAGTTGSGKSVSINDMILSILFKFSPDDCKLIMIDPKMLELSVYDEIPHLLTPVVTDPKKAVFALKWAVNEMENRYRQMSKLGVRNIDGFNKKLKESKEKGELLVRKVQTGFDQDTGRPIFETQQMDFESMPYIVVIVDEMADLMLVAGKDIESAVQRLAQMARAAGIHLIMATQRPSVDVITGTIKANFPTRISFQVTSKIDSRTILGEQGAEQLLGQGDMLYMAGGGRIIRVHGPFVKDNEVERIVTYIKSQGEPSYVDVVAEQIDTSLFGPGNENKSQIDELYNQAKEIILNDKKVSISYIQRKLQIGYNRAARIIEELENNGVISSPNHTGKREILL